MQVAKAVAVAFLISFLFGCGLYRERMYAFPAGATGRAVVAYRITTGLTDRKLELRLESKGRAVLLHSTNADWFDISCAAVSVSGINNERINYLVVPWGRQTVVGAYDVSTEKPLSEMEVDLGALRREMHRVYHRQRNFPRRPDAELLQWAQLSYGCRVAFHELYGSADNY